MKRSELKQMIREIIKEYYEPKVNKEKETLKFVNESTGGRLYGVFNDLDQYAKTYIPGASQLITKEDTKKLQKANVALLKIYKKVLVARD